jgi:hypothetical protein
MQTKSFEEKVESLSRKFEIGAKDWVRNDQIFNGMRNTPARIILALITVAVLYGFPALQFMSGGVSIWGYVVSLAVVILMQKLSVRFAFDDDSEIDEYQHKRRNRAYRRAYKRIGLIIGIGVALIAWNGAYLKATLGSGFAYSFDLASTNWMFVFAFLIGLFVLQKYLSWGIKGEPLEDSARKH